MPYIEQVILKAIAHILRIVADAIDVELNPSAPPDPTASLDR